MAFRDTGEIVSRHGIFEEMTTDASGAVHVRGYWLLNAEGRPIAKLLSLDDARSAARRLGSTSAREAAQLIAAPARNQ